MAGCTEGDWCVINAENFSSVKVKDVYVVGDAAIASDMPKSAYAAASQGTVVASDIVADLTSKPRTPGKYRNTCWSMLAPENSAKIGADYTAGIKDGKPHLDPHDSFVSKAGESAELRRETYNESAAWYESFTNTLFAKDVQATAGKVQ
jgi:NADPH-dependent 2,4-dienoyl-CoA reductase/sulfur reductase-like enzyme